MTDLTYLDMYCERMGDGALWAEPLNLVTNLAFIFAALWASRALARSAVPVRHVLDLWLLVVLLFAIGVGSGLWHAYPTVATVLMDVIPITLFINLYMVSALRRLFGLGWGQVVLWWGMYAVMGAVAQKMLPPDLLNGTIMYIPTYVALALMTLALRRTQPQIGHVFTHVLLVWTASLTFRTLDLEICQTVFIGTHFLWHLLNAWVLWRLLTVLSSRK